MDNHVNFSNSFNSDIKQVKDNSVNTGRNVINTSVNTTSSGIKVVKSIKGASTTAKTAPILTSKWFWIALLVIIVLIILISAIGHIPSASLTYTDNQLEIKKQEKSRYAVDFFKTQNIDGYVSSVKNLTNSADEILEYYIQSDSFNPEKLANYTAYVLSLSKALNDVTYTGSSLIGEGAYVFTNTLQKTFYYVYEILIRQDVNMLINEYRYEPDRTIESFKNEAHPLKNINFAEIIAVMSQGAFTLDKGSLEELFDILKNEHNIEKLYSLTIVERPVTTAVLLDSKTTTTYLYSLDMRDETEVGETTYSVILPINQLTTDVDVNDVTILKDLYQEAIDSGRETKKDEVNEIEDELSLSIIKDGRHIIFPCGKIPTIEFKTYCSANDIKITKHTYETNGFTVEYETLEQTVTYSTEAYVTYIYGDITINPYTLSDLYEMFDVDPYDYNVDFPTKKNIDILDSTELGIRTFVPDVSFGIDKRTPFNNSYSSYGLTNEELLKLLASYESGDISTLQKSIIDLCASCDGTPYSQPQRMNGPGSGFDCSSFTSWVYAQLGVFFSSSTYWQEGNKGHAPVAANICKYLENNGCEISPSELVVGDLVFWNYSNKNHDRYKTIDHVAIYVGNGMIYEASGSAGKVRTREIYGSDKIVSYCRPSKLLSSN